MRLPVIMGVIERRLLVNFRADPLVVAGLLPEPFTPVVVRGHAIVGICLIRLGSVRPRFLPALCGISSENAAHRIAVRWNDNGIDREGVYIPRRDTSSRLNTLLGGRAFPGVHNHAKFRVIEELGSYDVEMTSEDGRASLAVQGRTTTDWPTASTFRDLEEASSFFQGGSLGYSVTRERGVYDGLELWCREWKVEPLAVQSVRSSFFDDISQFPRGSIEFDCALVMRDVVHEWHVRAQMCCADDSVTAMA